MKIAVPARPGATVLLTLLCLLAMGAGAGVALAQPPVDGSVTPTSSAETASPPVPTPAAQPTPSTETPPAGTTPNAGTQGRGGVAAPPAGTTPNAGTQGRGGVDAPRMGATSVLARIENAQAGQTVRVLAGEFTGDVEIPDGVTVLGAGSGRSWIKGTVVYGSRCIIRDLKLGDASCSTRNGPGATRTLFERCRFVGGGETGDSWPDTSVLIIGSQYSCDHITFRRCIVERNVGKDPTFSNGFNNISLTERGGVHVEYILFDRCVVESSPRMGLEAYVAYGPDVTRGFKAITLRRCKFRQADAITVDFSDQPFARASGVLIEGCVIAGGGAARVRWGYGLCLEMPLKAVVRNNTFTRAWMQILMVTPRSETTFTGPAARITGNTFDVTRGVPSAADEIVSLKGDGNIFTGNRVKGSLGTNAVGLWEATRTVVRNNVFDRVPGTRAILENRGSSGNVLAPNAERRP